jgi:hypothetical protein
MDEGGKRQQGEGRTRDISEHGAFVFAADCPASGLSVGLKMDLEALPNGTESFPIAFDGNVVRVEGPTYEKGKGFAVLRESLADPKEDLSNTVLIGMNGDITLPLIGRVKAGGLTVEQLETELTTQYKEFMQDPQIFPCNRVPFNYYIFKLAILEIGNLRLL